MGVGAVDDRGLPGNPEIHNLGSSKSNGCVFRTNANLAGPKLVH